MRSHMQYTREEMYRMILVAQLNTGEKFNSEKFWQSMIDHYGANYFYGRTAAGLRQKWRALTKLYTVEELYRMNESFKDFMNKDPIQEKELRRRKKILQMIDSVDEQPYLDDELSVMSDDNTEFTNIRPSIEAQSVETGSKMSDMEMSIADSTVAEVQCDLMPDILVKLSQLSQSSILSMDQILKLLHQVSGNIGTLECYMKGEKVDMWTELEDIALKTGDESAMYKYMIGYKGLIAMENRKKYLGIS